MNEVTFSHAMFLNSVMEGLCPTISMLAFSYMMISFLILSSIILVVEASETK